MERKTKPENTKIWIAEPKNLIASNGFVLFAMLTVGIMFAYFFFNYLFDLFYASSKDANDFLVIPILLMVTMFPFLWLYGALRVIDEVSLKIAL